MNIKVIASIVLLSVPVLSLAADPSLDTEKKQFSYTVGFQMAQTIRQQGLDVDGNALAQAIKDVVGGGKLKLSPEEMQTASRAYMEKQEQKQRLVASKNLDAGKAFLTGNAKKKGVKTTASGLQYIIEKPGTGKKPAATNTVEVHYHGTLINGTEFDSSIKRGQPVTFPVNGVIKGWQEALTLMKEGAKWKVFIPADLAYGERGSGAAIGPNETLVFDIELLSIK